MNDIHANCPVCRDLNCESVVGGSDSKEAGQGRGECGFPLEAFLKLGLDVDRTERSGGGKRPRIEFQNAGAVIRLGDQDALLVGREANGLGQCAAQSFRHRALEDRHVLLMTDSSGQVWLVDVSRETHQVFADGHPVLAMQLSDGAIVQIGPLAWQFQASKRSLYPLTPIAGFELPVDAEVQGRLLRTEFQIHCGEMTALVGPSGCGKSTLLETIRDGSGLAGDLDTAGRVFFVPQQDLVHHDLRIGDALRLLGNLYRRDLLPFEIDAALDSVGLSPELKHKFPGELSGGQLRRFRIAGALLSGAGVIVLDEPDSGLDHETADEVISLLRSLAIRGATIVAVTHHRHVLKYFDRIVTMQPSEEGGIVENLGCEESRIVGEEGGGDEGSVSVVEERPVGAMKRLGVLLRRESLKVLSPVLSTLSIGRLRVPHCLVGLLLVPLLFASAVAVSVPTDPYRDVSDGLYGEMAPITRLGFLAVVSVIWMSSSGSHLSITRKREVYDYERSHGVSWAGVLGAKTVVLSIFGVCQTLMFYGWLYLIRDHWLQRSFFVDERSSQLVGVVFCLVVVSVAATMIGLLISALAGRSPLVATAILPVVMMFQILFSVPFAVSNPDGYEPLIDYQLLSIGQADDGAEQGSGLTGDEGDWDDDGWEDEESESERPLWVTSAVSYGTISRYGDQWIRSIAVTVDLPEGSEKVSLRCAGTLAVMSVVCWFGAWLVLWLQTTRIGVRRVRVVGAAVVLLVMMFPVHASAQEPAGTALAATVAAESAEKTIRVPLVDGRYDENQLRSAFGGSVDGKPAWREFGNQDRIGLVALELVGKIEFSLSEDELVIVLKQTTRWDLMRQLAPPRLLGVDRVGDANDVVVFVHGLEGGGATFAGASRLLTQRGVASIRFDYPNDGPPEEIGEQLSQQLIEFSQAHPEVRIHIVAHSLGGLISTWAVTEDGFPAARVPHLFTLGTPFRGSALAAFHDELELFDVIYRAATWTPGAFDTIADGRGEAAEALEPGSRFLARLHARKRPEAIEFHLSAGTKSFLSDSRRDALVAKLPGELARLAVDRRYAQRIDELLAAEELRDGLGDGAVTLRSALGLSNPASTRTFSLSHTALVSSVRPLEWVLEVAELGEPAKQLAK